MSVIPGKQIWCDAENGRENAQGTKENPFKHYRNAFDRSLVRENDVFMMKDGIYRGSRFDMPVSKVGFINQGERVEFTTFQILENWSKHQISDAAGNFWKHQPITGLTHRKSRNLDEYHTRPEIMRVNLTPIYHMYNSYDAERETEPRFFMDGPSEDPNWIILCLPEGKTPEDYLIEFGSDEYVFRPKNDSIDQIRFTGIIFTGGAGSDKKGAVATTGNYWKFIRCMFKHNSEAGLLVHGNLHHLDENIFIHNGVGGLDGKWARNCTLLNNKVIGNNIRLNPPNWHTNKWSNSSNNDFINHIAYWNYGPGLWFDIDNDNNRIRNSVFRDNTRANLMVELRSTDTFIDHVALIGAKKDPTGVANNLQIQATSRVYATYLTSIFSEGDGIRYKHTDNRGRVGNFELENSIIGYNANDIRFESSTPAALGDLFKNNIYLGDPTFNIMGNKSFDQWQEMVNSFAERTINIQATEINEMIKVGGVGILNDMFDLGARI